jgi:hypothetical protein
VPAPRATQHTPGLDDAQRVVPARPILRSQSEPQQPRGIGPGPLTEFLDLVARSDSYGHGIPGMSFNTTSACLSRSDTPATLCPAGPRFLAGPLSGSRTGDQFLCGSWFLAPISGSTNGFTAR